MDKQFAAVGFKRGGGNKNIEIHGNGRTAKYYVVFLGLSPFRRKSFLKVRPLLPVPNKKLPNQLWQDLAQ